MDREGLSTLIKKHRGTVSPTVHKKVSFVICTPQATKEMTQRVRKAVKFGIPLVNEKFLHQCIKKGKMIDHTPYTVPIPIRKKAAAAPFSNSVPQPIVSSVNSASTQKSSASPNPPNDVGTANDDSEITNKEDDNQNNAGRDDKTVHSDHKNSEETAGRIAKRPNSAQDQTGKKKKRKKNTKKRTRPIPKYLFKTDNDNKEK